MNQLQIILILAICISGYLSKKLSCTQNCTFGSSYNIGPVQLPLLSNQLCYVTDTEYDLLIDITKNGLAECSGTTVPANNLFYCENDGDQECAVNCGCNGLYTLCADHVKLTRNNYNLVCIQKEGDLKDVSFYPRCSQEADTTCGRRELLCPCQPCNDGEYRLKDENHCGEGYYLCQNHQWQYFPQNDTTVCSGYNNNVLCKNEPYCQVGPQNCYNGPLDQLECKLPVNNTCVKPCTAGKGYWNCTATECVEVIDTNLDQANTACHDTNNGPVWVDLLDFNNVCQCPSTDCTTTDTTAPLPTACPTPPPHHHPNGQPNPDVCPKEFGNFCLTPYRRGVGFVKCYHYIPLYIRIQEFEICIQTDPTHIIVKEAY